MKTPIIDFVEKYQQKNMTRFHMPGHKGHVFFGWEPFDITEIKGADVLHCGEGIIRESEKNASMLFGSGQTHYSTEGSTHCIKTMLAILKMEGRQTGQKNTILAARNVHRSMIDACALLGFDVEFLYGEMNASLCSCKITPEQLEDYLQKTKELPVAVYITSPDYLGQISDIKGLAGVCKQWQLPLLVDNAHGAYLHFLEQEAHPMDLGAAMCADSAHKTLPALTGGAYLHIHKEYTERFAPYIMQAMSLFGSTSPSYLIMQSLDYCNAYLSDNYRNRLSTAVEKICRQKESLLQKGIQIMESEPLKLVIETGKAGYTGEQIAKEMRRFQIEPEFADQSFVVLMLTPDNNAVDFERLEQWGEKTILTKAPKSPMSCGFQIQQKPKRVLSIREAAFSKSERIPVQNAQGRICAAEVVSCPPAIPIAVCGEMISKEMIDAFLAYDIKEIGVVNSHFNQRK